MLICISGSDIFNYFYSYVYQFNDVVVTLSAKNDIHLLLELLNVWNEFL